MQYQILNLATTVQFTFILLLLFSTFTNILKILLRNDRVVRNIMFKPILQKVNTLALKTIFMKNIYSIFKLKL